MADEFAAGVAVRDITPTPEWVQNRTNRAMTVRSDQPGSPLKIKTLVLSLGNTTTLLVAIDTCVLDQDHCDLLRKAISGKTRVAIDHIVVTSSHSHSTPFVEPLDEPHPYFDLICERAIEAAVAAHGAQQPARLGFGRGHVVGASFNTRVPLANGGVKFTRDFREGLATGRPIDPRVSILRVDDASGRPLAGWVRLALHPACVIFDAPLSAEYPGYMTDELSRTVGHEAPFLYSLGACGDVNCIPMFGTEEDTRCLGLNLAAWIGPMFDAIETGCPKRLEATTGTVDLPLDPPPSLEELDSEIAAVKTFCKDLETDPSLEWVMGVNCEPNWTFEQKTRHAGVLRDWAEKVKQQIVRGEAFPSKWRSQLATWVINDVALVFYSGEPLVELGLELAARSNLTETLLMGMCNGSDGYVGTDEDRRRGGYETYTNCRTMRLKPGYRPLPYALGAANQLIEKSLETIDALCSENAKDRTAGVC